MDKFIIYGGRKLRGEIDIPTAKNCVLVLMAASLLTEEKVYIQDCPLISDVFNMKKILEYTGCKIEWQGRTMIIDPANAYISEIPAEYARNLRGSIFVLGPLIARNKKARGSFPGGCDIGLRPIDLHIKGLNKLNVKTEEDSGCIYCDGSMMKGNRILLDFPSVGATENLMMASVLIKGQTIIENAAKEPEIIALQNMLIKMGAKIQGAGSPEIRIDGVKKLKGTTIRPISDRIVAGTMMIAAAITGGDIMLHKCEQRYLGALMDKLDGYSCDIKNITRNDIHIKGYKNKLSFRNISTGVYPAFPTDLQAPMCTLAAISQGTSIVTENIFETRFRHISELAKLGADIIVKDRTAVITGVNRLSGTTIQACDLRGGAALVLAGLYADGVTTVENISHIDRGYESLDTELNKIGAMIIRK